MTNETELQLQRFNLTERLVHWVVGITFVLLLLTGLAFSYPSLFWLTVLLGGGPSARLLHPWIGLTFTIGAGAMFVIWLRDMSLSSSDLDWLKAIKHYATNNKQNVPPAGKYNAGQKVFFWTQSLAGALFFITGLPLWFPDGFLVIGEFGSGTLATMRFLHYVGALGAGLLLVPHIYLGTLAFPGTLRGMLHGTVSSAWAETHHPQWRGDKAER